MILINGDTITVSFGDSKSYIVSKDELTLIKTPKRKYSEDDPYGEEQWEDKTEYEESKLKDPSRIKKFFDTFSGKQKIKWLDYSSNRGFSGLHTFDV